MTNRLAVFIHGLGGDSVATWAKFPALLCDDVDVAGRYADVASFQYQTSTIGPTRPLSEIALELANFLAAKTHESKVDEVAFITHSQGGLLARRYLCDALDRGTPMPIFRLLTFATPHWGAYSESAAWFVPDSRAQQKELAFDADAILSVNNDWARTDAEDRINVQRVIAGDDAIVPKFSALGANFNNDYRVVPGYGHIDVVKVNDVSHPSFQIAKTFLLAPTSHQSALVNPDKTPPVLSVHWHDHNEFQGASRFVYSTRYVPFLGREREKSQVMAFLHSPTKENVAWMWVKGQGGVGKSRFALELCLAWQADWYAGFLNRDADAPDWSRWQPQLPTFLVIDYATADADKLGRLLRGLCNRDDQRRLRRPVRVLLLDRHQQEDRLKQAIGEGVDAININDCRQPDLDLVTIDDPWAIMEHFISRTNMPMLDKAQALASLTLVDPAQRPLFAMLLADALAQRVDIGTITRESLLDNVLKRERAKYWLPVAKECGAVLEKIERLLAFATMVNGLALDKVKSPIDEWDPDVVAPVFEIMAGYDRQTDTIAPLTPDLLGECFVLQQLNLMQKQKAYGILTLAWNQSPFIVFEFFSRVVQDFPLDTMLEYVLDVSPVSREGRIAWAVWVANLIGRTTKQLPARAVRACKTLTALAAAYPNEPKIRLLQAKAAVNLINHLATLDSVTSKAVFTELRALAATHPDEPKIRLEQAEAASILIHALVTQDTVTTKDIFTELCALAATHPNEPEIRLKQAQAALNLTYYIATTDPLTAKAVFTELCVLAVTYPNEPEIRLLEAKAALNLINGLIQAHPEFVLINGFITPDSTSAMVVFGMLSALATKHPNEPKISLEQAKAALNLINHLGTPDPATAKAVFTGLCTLATKHPNEPEIKFLQARAASSLIYGLATLDPVTAKAVFTGLCALAAAHPNEPEIRLKQAQAAVNLINELATSEPAAAKTIFTELCALAAAHLDEPEIHEAQSFGVRLVVQHFNQNDEAFVLEAISEHSDLLDALIKRQQEG